jgi:hypothetical protein
LQIVQEEDEGASLGRKLSDKHPDDGDENGSALGRMR